MVTNANEECKHGLIWDFEERTYRTYENADGERCTSITSFPLPFVIIADDIFVKEGSFFKAGYTHASLYKKTFSWLSPKAIRHLKVLDISEYDSCDFCLIDEKIGLSMSPEKSIEYILSRISRRKPNLVYILTGYNDTFFLVYEKYGKTFLDYLFKSGYLDELNKTSKTYIVTSGLITHNDIQIALEYNIGIILCIDSREEKIPLMLPIEYVLNNKGKVYISVCEYRPDMPSAFLTAYVAKTLFSYYRRKEVLSELEFLSMMYSWWREISVEPDLLIYSRYEPELMSEPSLLKLMQLGAPDWIILDGSKWVLWDFS